MSSGCEHGWMMPFMSMYRLSNCEGKAHAQEGGGRFSIRSQARAPTQKGTVHRCICARDCAKKGPECRVQAAAVMGDDGLHMYEGICAQPWVVHTKYFGPAAQSAIRLGKYTCRKAAEKAT